MKAAVSWRVWQRGEPRPGRAGAPDWVVATGAGLAVPPLVVVGAGGLVAVAWCDGLLLEHAEASSTEQAATPSTAKPRTGDLG